MSEGTVPSDKERKVLVIAHPDDQDTLEPSEPGTSVLGHDGLKAVLQDFGFKCVFSYDLHPGSLIPSDFDEKKEECGKYLFIISKNSLPHQDRKPDESQLWMEHCRKGLPQYAPFVIDKDIKIDKLPVEIKVFTCITVRDDAWKNKLSSYLGKEVVGSCPPLGKIAPGLCCSYVQSYLDTVLPGFEENVREWEEAKKPKDGRVVKKMMNLIPKSCNCEPGKDFQSIAYYDRKNISREEKKVEVRRNHLETSKRNFDMPMYRVQDPKNPSKVYYAVLMLNSTIHTLHEMCQDQGCGLDYETMMKERSLFEAQMIDMMIGKPIEIIPFDEKEGNLTKLIVEKCRNCVQ